MNDVFLQSSKSILGKKVFANRDFKKGEIVVKYRLKKLTQAQFQKLPKTEKMATHVHSGLIYLYSSPERYVNHSTRPNTIQDLDRTCDIALRRIQKGDEITTNSAKDDV